MPKCNSHVSIYKVCSSKIHLLYLNCCDQAFRIRSCSLERTYNVAQSGLPTSIFMIVLVFRVVVSLIDQP